MYVLTGSRERLSAGKHVRSFGAEQLRTQRAEIFAWLTEHSQALQMYLAGNPEQAATHVQRELGAMPVEISEERFARRVQAALRRQHSGAYDVMFMVTHRCNLNCRGCCNGAPLQAAVPDATVDQVHAVATRWRMLADVQPDLVIAGGGEPLLHRDLPDVLQALRRGFPDSRLELQTNGLLVPNDELLDLLVRLDVELVVSFYGPGVHFVGPTLTLPGISAAEPVDCTRCCYGAPMVIPDWRVVSNPDLLVNGEGDVFFCGAVMTAWWLRRLHELPYNFVDGVDVLNVFKAKNFEQIRRMHARGARCSFSKHCASLHVAPFALSSRRVDEYVQGVIEDGCADQRGAEVQC